MDSLKKIVMVVACISMAGCASTKQLSRDTGNGATIFANDSYRKLEQRLIADYLDQSRLEEQELAEEVMVYNNNDELEYRGEMENNVAKKLVRKGDLLIAIYHMHIYRINK